MRRRFVIARHSENLQWTERLKDEIFIYNSGDLNSYTPHLNERGVRYIGERRYCKMHDVNHFEYNASATLINVPNIGREAGKWLEYLINYYGNYARLNIFLQGYPFDHITLDSIINFFSAESFGYIQNKNGNLHDNEFESQKWLINPHGYDQEKIYKIIYGDDIPKRFQWYVGGQFFITYSLLMRNKKSYYERLREILTEFSEDGPYCFERSWLTFLMNPPKEYLV